MYNLENPDYKGIAEYQVFKRLIETYPTGILSVVSDTFDLFKVITEYLPRLKEEILARDGKLVIRPDSGDPVDILCGTEDYTKSKLSYEDVKDMPVAHPSAKGVIELLWDVFGGTVNEQGYKVLDPHIGAIYGDSITIDRANEICRRLEAKGFASTNVVLGIGSFTYQYNTRDTFGFAMKATYVEVNGEGREIFKDPITDDGTKKSATGLLSVIYDDNNEYKLIDKVDWATTNEGALQTIYKNGQHLNQTSLEEIRNSLKSEKSNKAMMV
jgi:nicotinamide phosphoribosyltransferase